MIRTGTIRGNEAMSNEPDDAEFTFGPKTGMDDLKSFLSESLDSKVSVTCPKCGDKVEGTFKELLRGLQCKCGETVRSKKLNR
jgi:hypothetical protein